MKNWSTLESQISACTRQGVGPTPRSRTRQGQGGSKAGLAPSDLSSRGQRHVSTSRQAPLPVGEVGRDAAHRHGPRAIVSYRHCHSVGDHLGGLDISHMNRGMCKCDKHLQQRIGNVA